MPRAMSFIFGCLSGRLFATQTLGLKFRQRGGPITVISEFREYIPKNLELPGGQAGKQRIVELPLSRRNLAHSLLAHGRQCQPDAPRVIRISSADEETLSLQFACLGSDKRTGAMQPKSRLTNRKTAARGVFAQMTQ